MLVGAPHYIVVYYAIFLKKLQLTVTSKSILNIYLSNFHSFFGINCYENEVNRATIIIKYSVFALHVCVCGSFPIKLIIIYDIFDIY